MLLVGVINADTSLHFPDFRASERTFQLVTQVAGRTGRGPRGGRVLVQTLSPDHPAIRAAVRHDYAMFAKQELPIRQMLHYPPYTQMARLIVRGEAEALVKEFALQLAERIRSALVEHQLAEGVQNRVLGPAPAPIPRLRNLYRYHLQAQCGDGQLLRQAILLATENLSSREGVQWAIDIDPLDML
ncbi:MAG: hypothetical protein SGJ20_10735 [Planctomycetota bacterium]|nr:hypothetical protein [Planctomycetota bacterium]